jgi:glycosyltransferase involved in cell wall biosynthesis
MTKVVSIVTPAYKPVPEYLVEAYNSLRTQKLPTGWEWEWVIQQDGHEDNAPSILLSDPRVNIATGRRAGEPTARNLCLARARGELIKVLDADDQLAAGALAREIDVMSSNSEIGWTTAKVLDLLPDGSTVGFDWNPEDGVIELGRVFDFWRSHNYRADVHPATLCLRRSLVMALGGWMALPASGDTGLLIAANTVALGYFIGEVGLLYRKWPGQMTNQPAHNDPAEWSARMAIIEERARSLKTLWNPETRSPN